MGRGGLVKRLVHFGEKPFFKIVHDGRDVGTVSVMRLTATSALSLSVTRLPGKGLGTRVLQHCLFLADEQGLPVRLEHLKWNRSVHCIVEMASPSLARLRFIGSWANACEAHTSKLLTKSRCEACGPQDRKNRVDPALHLLD
jgi:hypothetical protein